MTRHPAPAPPVRGHALAPPVRAHALAPPVRAHALAPPVRAPAPRPRPLKGMNVTTTPLEGHQIHIHGRRPTHDGAPGTA
jgi:hypothetical protein